MRQQHPPPPAAPEQTASDQKLHDAMVVVARFLVLALIDVRVAFVSFAALPEQVGEKQPAAAAAAEQPAGDQEADDTAIVAAPFLIFTVIDVRVVIVGLAALPEEMGEKQPAATTATEQPAGDQEADDTAIVAAAFLIFAVIDVRVVIVGLAALPEEMREKQPAAAAVTQHAARDQEAHDAMVVFAALTVPVVVDLVFGAGLSSFVQEFREQEASYALAAKQPTGGEKSGDIAVPRVTGSIGCANTHGCSPLRSSPSAARPRWKGRVGASCLMGWQGASAPPRPQ